ncbi:ATPase AAA [Geotalea uraniireducens]|uniref:ATPase AAA n=1 Tax=Geotalea uraniireducens TaxID=351604 RepID=A0ABM8ENG6_9BACT|nr:AAA family ATPase [Geotalea uraniireducens]BDV43575.1 ATPase AAA [Geotalea uraniireducens]
MYCEHFGFSEPPFALTPNPGFLFLSTHHQEAFAHLLYGIDNHAGFIELSGEVGTGKTTVIRTFLSQLDPDTYRTALIFNPTISPLGLLQGISREFGLPGTSSEKGDLLDELNRFLLDENRAGHTVVLVIDEAQNLSAEVLEQIRLISNLETDRDKLIQIVLVGQPELRLLLARDELRQLNQRITVRYHLEPMELEDTGEYIRHRIRIAAGGREPVHFSPAAVKRIYRYSGGLPRLINGVCDRGLLLAYTREARHVTPAMVRLAIADLRKDEARPAFRFRYAVLAGTILVAAAAAGALVREKRGNSVPPPARSEAAPPPATAVAPFSLPTAIRELAAVPERDNLLTAVNALLATWQAPPLASPGKGRLDPQGLVQQRGLAVSEFTGTLDSLARLDAPALLQIPLPAGNRRFVALTGLVDGRATVTPAIAGRTTLTAKELQLLWNGRALLLWKNFLTIPTRLKQGSRDKGVKPLQELLRGAGAYQGRTSGVYDKTTQEAIRRFQQTEGLAPDGRAGERTLLLLYRRGGGFFPPGLAHSAGSNGKNGQLTPATITTKEQQG